MNVTHIHRRSQGGQYYVRGQITNLAGQQLNVDDSFNDLAYDAQWADHVDFAMFRIAAGIHVTPLPVSLMKTNILIPDGTISFPYQPLANSHITDRVASPTYRSRRPESHRCFRSPNSCWQPIRRALGAEYLRESVYCIQIRGRDRLDCRRTRGNDATRLLRRGRK